MPISPPQAISQESADIDLDYIFEDPYPEPQQRNYTDMSTLDNGIEIGVVEVDESGNYWMWQRCYCTSPLCDGKALRPVHGKREMSSHDRGRLEG